MSSLVAVILGAGSNIGRATALKLKSEGYKVAVASRSVDAAKAEADGLFPLPLDLAKPSTVPAAFDKVVKHLGVPTVLVYNAANVTFVPPTEPFSPTVAQLETANAVNCTSFYSALQEFIKHGRTLPASTQKYVLYTGNALNKIAMAPVVTLGTGKNAAAHIIAVGASSSLVDEGFRFYFVDERNAEGQPAGAAVSGAAHAEVYSQLAKEKAQKPWNVLFVSPGKITEF